MRLSRAAVLARAKAVALDGVRRLNCWWGPGMGCVGIGTGGALQWEGCT